ncbi:MAG: right-handed parallel beta-helix repeat-containing protein [Terracidiphilus sp.]
MATFHASLHVRFLGLKQHPWLVPLILSLSAGILSGCGGTSSASTTPPPTSYTLTVQSVTPSSGVPIYVLPADNSNTTTGATGFTLSYNPGTAVTLTAPNTAAGNSFSSWNGCTTSSTVSCNVTMNANTTVTANYVAPGPGYAFLSTPGLMPYVAAPYTVSTNYYVDAVNGSDSNNGLSTATAWKTISQAISSLSNGNPQGGVAVNVAPGTYTESLSIDGLLQGTDDSPGGYVVFRSSTRGAAVLMQPPTGATNLEIANTHYIIFDGFEVTGIAAPGYTGDGIEFYHSDHIMILNNIVHDVGGAGLGGIFADYFTVQGNIVYNTAGYVGGAYATSGIDFYEPVAVDLAPGFHNIVSNNISYHNSELNNGSASHTEGHGIMCDDFTSSQGASNQFTGGVNVVYTPQTLIENNLVFGNGGVGINLFSTDDVTVMNNTAFNDGKDPLITSYNFGEISVLDGGQNTVVNNIGYADTGARPGGINYALYDTNDPAAMSNVWANNLSFDGTPGQPSVGGSSSPITAANGNILGTDPLFNSGVAGDFSLAAGSPAIGAGTAAYGAPTHDLGGNPQTSPPVIGAYAGR